MKQKISSLHHTMSVVKRAKTENGLVSRQTNTDSAIQLQGHENSVLAVEYDPTGEYIASGSSDKSILLWYHQNNFGQLTGHKGAVLDVKWSRDGKNLYSCSSDLTIGTWDVDTGKRLVKHEGHQDMINTITTPKRGSERIISGSDDGSIAIFDPVFKNCVQFWQTEYPVLAVACDDAGAMVYSAGIDSQISAWDIRNTSKPVYLLSGHNQETVTSLKVSPDGETLASNGRDNTVRTWDIRPFCTTSRTKLAYDGALHGMEHNLHRIEWSHDGSKLAAASADSTVVIWDTNTRRIVHKLTGHQGSVNDITLNKNQMLASGSTDRSVIVGSF